MATPKRKRARVALDLQALTGREELWRFSSAAERDPAVERWFEHGAPELKAIAHRWFTQLRRCGPNVRELLHDGCPVACVEDAAFAYVNAFKSHVNVGFFHGASLEDPTGLLQGSGKRMRHVKLSPDRAVDDAALRRLIGAAYSDVLRRLAAAEPR